jgi:hypothetical protein
MCLKHTPRIVWALGIGKILCVILAILYAFQAARFSTVEPGEGDRILAAVCGRESRTSSLTLINSAGNSGFGPRLRWFQFSCSMTEMSRLKTSILSHAALTGWTVDNAGSESSMQIGIDRHPEWWRIRQHSDRDILGVHQPGGASFWFVFCPNGGLVYLMYDSH